MYEIVCVSKKYTDISSIRKKMSSSEKTPMQFDTVDAENGCTKDEKNKSPNLLPQVIIKRFTSNTNITVLSFYLDIS